MELKIDKIGLQERSVCFSKSGVSSKRNTTFRGPRHHWNSKKSVKRQVSKTVSNSCVFSRFFLRKYTILRSQMDPGGGAKNLVFRLFFCFGPKVAPGRSPDDPRTSFSLIFRPFLGTLGCVFVEKGPWRGHDPRPIVFRTPARQLCDFVPL